MLPLRFVCQVTSTVGDIWADRAFHYFEELRTRFPIRVLPQGAVDLGVPGRWSPYRDAFALSLPDRYVNVICWPWETVGQFLTSGVPNVAITNFPEPVSAGWIDRLLYTDRARKYDASKALADSFDLIATASAVDAARLQNLGANVMCAHPMWPGEFEAFMEELARCE